MAGKAAWEKKDDWYWLGPDGWTICRMRVRDDDKFMLWCSGEGGPRAMLDTFDAAVKHYDKINP